MTAVITGVAYAGLAPAQNKASLLVYIGRYHDRTPIADIAPLSRARIETVDGPPCVQLTLAPSVRLVGVRNLCRSNFLVELAPNPIIIRPRIQDENIFCIP
jgi:hypothetical protein